jgi:hypothetical protein
MAGPGPSHYRYLENAGTLLTVALCFLTLAGQATSILLGLARI